MTDPNKLLLSIVEKATPYGQQDGEFIAYYIIPTGPIHRAILHLQQHGYAIPNPDHGARQRRWIQCSTCNGSGLRYWNVNRDTASPCPDCVDGLVPTPELVERVAEAIKTEWSNGGWAEAEVVAKVALLASRQGDTT